MATTFDSATSDDEIQARRLEADKSRPMQCACGHSKQAHDSGTAFCWLCDCNEWSVAE